MNKITQSLAQKNKKFFLDLLSRLHFIPDPFFLKLLYFAEIGKWPNLNHPKLLNEKLQWLKIHNRKPIYTLFADKVKVKDYIAKTIGPEYIIPTLGVWEKVEDIDFACLPNKFVIKLNHNSGLGMYLCKDKNKINEKEIRRNLQKGLDQNYYKCWREWPYKDIPRRIIAEQFIENTDKTPIADFKFYCFGGKPRYFMYSVGETSHHALNHKFDMKCNSIDYLFKKETTLSADKINIPNNFSEMVNIVEKLCKGFPHIRIDLYNVDGKIYFGEMTFFSGAGFIRMESTEFSQKMSDLITLE